MVNAGDYISMIKNVGLHRNIRMVIKIPNRIIVELKWHSIIVRNRRSGGRWSRIRSRRNMRCRRGGGVCGHWGG